MARALFDGLTSRVTERGRTNQSEPWGSNPWEQSPGATRPETDVLVSVHLRQSAIDLYEKPLSMGMFGNVPASLD